MTTPHRATPEQWDYVDVWGVVHKCVSSSCILELRARIEALEAAQQDKLDRLIALDQEAAMTELRAASAEARPAGRLWERMEKAGHRELDDNPHAEQAEFYQAMIREVAAFLEAIQGQWCDSAAEVVAELVAELRQEADRG